MSCKIKNSQGCVVSYKKMSSYKQMRGWWWGGVCVWVVLARFLVGGKNYTLDWCTLLLVKLVWVRVRIKVRVRSRKGVVRWA
jgi:hypothetical protein